MKQVNFIKNFNNCIEKGKVSVLSTCYDEDYQENEVLLKSMNTIDYPNFELLLMIDDDFNEKYNEIYDYCKNLNIKKQIFYSGQNLGNYTHYNTLINYSDAEFIFITEPNTIWNKNLINECVNIFNSKENIDVIQYKYHSYQCDNATNLDYYDKIFANSDGWAWGDAMLVFRKSVFKEIGYFENARVGADSDLWKRIKKLIPSKIYCLDINGFISIGHRASKKFPKERECYWNSEILPVEKYCYLNNNDLQLNFNFVENLAPVVPYKKEVIDKKKNILLIGHDWDFIDNIIDKFDKNKFNIEKYYFAKSFDWVKANDCPLTEKLINRVLKDDHKTNYYSDSSILKYYEELCNQYDIVFCEWFEILVPILSLIENKKFKLIVRLHSYEYFFAPVNNNEYFEYDENKYINDFDNKALYLSVTNWNNIDKLLVVNDWFKDKISKDFAFNNIITIPNYYKTYDNVNSNVNTRKKNIGIVGINPLITKGLYDMLIIFQNLVKHDNEYKLYIKGDLDRNLFNLFWIDRDRAEQIFNKTLNLYDEMINNYPDNIILCKHSNDGGESMQTFYSKIGYLLTASIQESFHCVIMESGTAGCIPLMYKNKEYKNIDVARTPLDYTFISFDEKNDVINYIIHNERFEELSKNASEYYNNMNTSIQDFTNLFDSYNDNEVDNTFILINYDDNKINEYEKIIFENIENNLIFNKKIEIINVSEEINTTSLNDLKNAIIRRCSEINLNLDVKIVSINLKKDINIHFKILIGIKNANSQNINIIFNSPLNIKKIPFSKLDNYNQFIIDRIKDNSYLNLTNLADFVDYKF